ncbi:methyltransferase domain-containing protein [bacterium AH-315-C08]|nr:methyltransferase domain-containing protein [bacterium AH-315-C08]
MKYFGIGCGGGWNLIHFSKAGYNVVGYDYSPNLTQVGRTYGLDLREGTIQDIEGEYDIRSPLKIII